MRNGGRDQDSVIGQEAVAPRVLRLPEANYHGEVIGKIAGNRCHVSLEMTVDAVADLFNRDTDLLALGVVDREGVVQGIIERRSLLGRLSRQYGRDVYRNRDLATVVETVPSFDHRRNILSIAEKLHEELHDRQTSYYLLTNNGNRFAGIFSTKDLLVYLSDITRKDIALARTLQERMIGRLDGLSAPETHFAYQTKMAKGVGGDFAFIRKIGDTRWVFLLADVSGKGISASLVTAILDGVCHAFDFAKGVPALINGLNDYIVERFEGEKYLTGVFVEYDAALGVAAVYDMGHSLVYLLREGRFFRIRTAPDNLPVGLVPGAGCRVDRVPLKEGDVLVLLTDGVLEQTNEAGEEFGVARAASIVKAFAPFGMEGVPKELFRQIHSFRGGQPQHDDMSVMLMSPEMIG